MGITEDCGDWESEARGRLTSHFIYIYTHAYTYIHAHTHTPFVHLDVCVCIKHMQYVLK